MGKSCRDLSDEFDLSVKTVYTYRTRLLEKLRLRNDIDMLRYALRHNLLVGEDAPLSIDPDEEI
jgi:DNA-binding CsgD family transcriptional regulator